MGNLRINFNKDLKMHLACSTDELRLVMNYIYFKDGFAFASDGLILVKNKLEECSSIPLDQIEELDNKFLHKDHFKEILKYDIINISKDGIEAQKTNGGDKLFFYFSRFDDLKYPNAEKVFQDALNKSNASLTILGLNLKLIDRLRKALHDSDLCTFRFKGSPSDLNVIFENAKGDQSIGLIMPLNLD